VHPLDDLDWKILGQLQEDGRRSYREISDRLAVSPGTVRSRVLSLIRDHLVQVIAVPNSSRMGFRFHAVVGLQLQPGSADEVADVLTARPEVGWVGLTASGYDVMFEVVLPNGRAFGPYKERFLSKFLPTRVDVFELWDVRKFNYNLLSSGRVELDGDALRDELAEEEH
jgi:DNA-binding Lrp family transcriptional regulator